MGEDNFADRFWSNVAIAGDDDCWEWQASRSHQGYGATRYQGRNVRAHRVAWLLTCGEILEGFLVCHRCDNPSCCNPSHLWLGTVGDNTRDSIEKGRHFLPTNNRGVDHVLHRRRLEWLATAESWRRCAWCNEPFQLGRKGSPVRCCSPVCVIRDRYREPRDPVRCVCGHLPFRHKDGLGYCQVRRFPYECQCHGYAALVVEAAQ